MMISFTATKEQYMTHCTLKLTTEQPCGRMKIGKIRQNRQIE